MHIYIFDPGSWCLYVLCDCLIYACKAWCINHTMHVRMYTVCSYVWSMSKMGTNAWTDRKPNSSSLIARNIKKGSLVQFEAVEMIKNPPKSWQNCRTILYRGSKGVAHCGSKGVAHWRSKGVAHWGSKGWRQGVKKGGAPPQCTTVLKKGVKRGDLIVYHN